MNKHILLDAIGFLDEELLADHLKRKWEIRNKVKKDWRIRRWSAIAASFIVVSASVLLYYRFASKTEIPSVDTKPPSVQMAPPRLEIDALEGVIFDSKVYYLEGDLSKTATEENLGEMLGQVSWGTVYAYISDDDKTDRIIIEYNDRLLVFSFDSYAYDGTGN